MKKIIAFVIFGMALLFSNSIGAQTLNPELEKLVADSLKISNKINSSKTDYSEREINLKEMLKEKESLETNVNKLRKVAQEAASKVNNNDITGESSKDAKKLKKQAKIAEKDAEKLEKEVENLQKLNSKIVDTQKSQEKLNKSIEKDTKKLVNLKSKISKLSK